LPGSGGGQAYFSYREETVRVFDFKIRLEDSMADTLEALAVRNDLTPRGFVEQLVEVQLAEYRLSSIVTPGGYGGRHLPRVEAELVEHRLLTPADTLEML
jgi:hypothetical protein